jgi:YHS domain-containing protein
MDTLNNILWIIAIWWMLSRMLRTARIIQQQKMLQKNQAIIEHEKEKLKQKQQEVTPLEMVKDAACGKHIEKSQAYQLYQEENTYYFCSWDCREKFIKEHLKQSE